MFISKYGKTYDNADGTEQAFADAGSRGGAGSQRGGQIGRERWEDDGGPANDLPVPQAASKPPWSVLSLRDFNELIRREGLADDPARLRLQAERAKRRAAAVRQRDDDDLVARQRAVRDRYRNAWETT
jgi:hypothetical protein